MEYFFVTWQEVSDNKYVNSEHVLEVVKTVNDYYTADRGNDVPLALRITYKNYCAATERIRDVQVARCAFLKKKAEEDIHELHKCEIKAQVARANREGAVRELKRFRGEKVPEEPETTPEVGDFEVQSSTDGEGVKRRKAILKARNHKEQRDQLPSASTEDKERIRKTAVWEKRAKRAAAK